ncbi:MAG: RHS repeat domain-containing protein, partial [Thermoanaerobaculia bacterium]
FDYADRPTSASSGTATLVSSAAYLPFGPAKDIVYGNGTEQTMSYDARYRLMTNKLAGQPGTIDQHDYSYDATGNIIQLADALDAGYSRIVGYDDLNRLTTANTGASLWGTGSYTYDTMGNMLQSKLGDPAVSMLAGEADFTYVGTTPKIATVRNTSLIDTGGLSLKKRRARASSVGYSTVRYDAAGNEISYVATRSYSPRNLLESVTDASEANSNPHRLEYGYDGRGIRLVRSETQSDGTRASRYYTYSPELQLLSVTGDDGPNVWTTRIRTMSLPPAAQEFIWFGGRPLAQFASDAGPSLRWYYDDHLGTPLLQTDSNGWIVWQAEYEPYGGIWKLRVPPAQDEIQSPRIEQPLRFPGQDVAMNWEGSEERYNIFRWYRAGWGRYTQSDPTGLRGGVNVFAYVGERPTRFIDPYGLVKVSCCGENLEKAINNARRRMSLAETTGSADDPTGSNNVVAVTRCQQFTMTGPSGEKRQIGVPETSRNDSFEDGKCEFLCTSVHEAYHRQQCREFGARELAGRLTEAQWEWPAYREELRCLQSAQKNKYLNIRSSPPGFVEY